MSVLAEALRLSTWLTLRPADYQLHLTSTSPRSTSQSFHPPLTGRRPPGGR